MISKSFVDKMQTAGRIVEHYTNGDCYTEEV